MLLTPQVQHLHLFHPWPHWSGKLTTWWGEGGGFKFPLPLTRSSSEEKLPPHFDPWEQRGSGLDSRLPILLLSVPEGTSLSCVYVGVQG